MVDLKIFYGIRRSKNYTVHYEGFPFRIMGGNLWLRGVAPGPANTFETLIFKNIKTEFDGVLIWVGKPYAKEFGCRLDPCRTPYPTRPSYLGKPSEFDAALPLMVFNTNVWDWGRT